MAQALSTSQARILILERGGFVPQEDENWDPEAVWKKLRYRAKEQWLDDRGQEVVDAFLPLDADFWNDDRTRYTVFFDPGRVKRGILPNKQMGRALAAGKRYTLLVKREWRDGHGLPLKEEFRQSEGDPIIRGKLKAARQQRAKKRMIVAVPKATVVITNPTHFAVALQYDKGMLAPICVAKGVDAIALKIREVAAEHRVPIVENRPLARALHAALEVDQAIPPEHYKAVAEVIGYVMRLRRMVKAA